jgi:hypothetical protein
MQTPTVGRIVHYHTVESTQPKAAIIVAVDGERCDLHVFDLNPSACMCDSVLRLVPFSESPENGRWTWPPRA